MLTILKDNFSKIDHLLSHFPKEEGSEIIFDVSGLSVWSGPKGLLSYIQVSGSTQVSLKLPFMKESPDMLMNLVYSYTSKYSDLYGAPDLIFLNKFSCDSNENASGSHFEKLMKWLWISKGFTSFDCILVVFPLPLLLIAN